MVFVVFVDLIDLIVKETNKNTTKIFKLETQASGALTFLVVALLQ